MPPSAYYDSFSPELIKLIPPDVGSVLEIGCGAGALAERYRPRNPAVRWYGIEADEAAREIAAGRMTECWHSTVEECDFDASVFPEHPVDCLIFGDVLEHLVDPWGQLCRLAGLVKPGGLVLASIPNVQHYGVIMALLAGQWRYQDQGLLDRTHLRFFTLEGVRELFRGAGLEPFEIRGVKPLVGHSEQAHRALVDMVLSAEAGNYLSYEQVLGICRDQLERNTAVYQWVVRAVRAQVGSMDIHGNQIRGNQIRIGGNWSGDRWKPEPLRIQAVTAEECCARPRIREPLAALATIPGVRLMDKDPDILIVQRRADVPLDFASGDGPLVIREIDDHPAYLEGMAANDWASLRQVHAVQCSTEAIAEFVRQYNPAVEVFPNQLAELPPWRRVPADDVEVSIFFGAQNRQEDWRPFMPLINRVIREHRPDNLVFRVLHDREFFEALETGQKTFDPFLAYEAYLEILRACDIALIPLEDTPFNRCKSDLKFLECSAEGVACLMSEFAADRLEPIATNDAYRCYFDGHSFERSLRDLVEHPIGRRRTARLAHDYARGRRMLGQHYRRQYEWYLSLLSHKSELHRQLVERIAGPAALPAGLP